MSCLIVCQWYNLVILSEVQLILEGVISTDIFNDRAKLAIVCPITNTNNEFPLHVPLDERTTTTGVVLCEHIRSLDLNSRSNSFIERIPDDILRKVVDIITAEIEISVPDNE